MIINTGLRETLTRRNYRLIIVHSAEADPCRGEISRFRIIVARGERPSYGRRDAIWITARYPCVKRNNRSHKPRSFANIPQVSRMHKFDRAHLASLLRMLGDLFTAICDGDLSISLAFSALAFSKTWKRDFTFRLESSSSPRSGLSEAEIQRERISPYVSSVIPSLFLVLSRRCTNIWAYSLR